MRRFEHLPGILRMIIGVVVLHSPGNHLQYSASGLGIEVRCELGQVIVSLRKRCECLLQQFQFRRVDHGVLDWLIRRGAYRKFDLVKVFRIVRAFRFVSK
jgi:hypothetical protein